jgi:hypothetical protein
MIYFLALIPATGLTIAGYVVLFLSNRAEGAMRSFGKYLGFWAFTLAALLILGSIFAAAHGAHRCHVFGMHGPHERMLNPSMPESMGPRGDRPPQANTPDTSEAPKPTQNP